jgi:putative selenate reductase
MAQNVVLSWLAGARVLELKTVQLEDRLRIPRPCIDMANVGYNVEWSQELRLAQSLREYVKGSMLLDVVRGRNLLGWSTDPGKDATILDLSVGYELAGIRSEPVRAWLAAMKDARALVEELRREIPDQHRSLRELEYRSLISDQVTLSTFHGCPAPEIEAMALFLMEEMGLNVTVKLNPTLLGRERVEGLLHEALGYTEIETRPEDFARDLAWERALELADRLAERGRALGRGFRIKLANTLVVRNHRSVFPPGERVMYLSGVPLHAITLSLVERFRRARPALPISFSAGVDALNFPDCVALGLVPVTACTDLLKTGGYGRLPRYLDNLERRMRSLGVCRLDDYLVKACGQGEAAVRSLSLPRELEGELLAELAAPHSDLQGVLSRAGRPELSARLAEAAAALNTPRVLERVLADPRYRAEANRAVPRKVGSRLALFDCLSCDKCLPVCPNDANFVYETRPCALAYSDYRVRKGVAEPVPGGRFEIRERRQLATYQDFCNDCGNCDTFCPEDGGPYLRKPCFFGSLGSWRALAGRDGFFVRRDRDAVDVWGRVRGTEYHLQIDRAQGGALFTDGVLRLELRHEQRRVTSVSAARGAPEGHRLDFSAYLAMAAVVDGVLDPSRANPVNSAL